MTMTDLLLRGSAWACALGLLFGVGARAQDKDSLKPFLIVFGEPLKPVWNQPRTAVAQAQIELGRLLYFEKRLSRDDSISCNSCHDTKRFGVDGKAFSVGFDKHLTGRNSPTSFNAFMHIAQFWDGRAPTVEEQAKGPILAGGEMAMPSGDGVVAKLGKIKGYPEKFKEAFPDSDPALTYDHVGKAIGAYERLFVTPGRFDKLLGGDAKALNEQEIRGLKLFTTTGCTTCHNGPLVGGNVYQKVGLVKPWPNQKDQGRFGITKVEADRMFFKVPSLRNIEKTAPYFHDATGTTLEMSIATMARHQLNKELPQEEIAALAAFLKSLTGELPDSVTDAPKSFPGK